jgi:drug/metabolite transporter (DMT)-like permease
MLAHSCWARVGLFLNLILIFGVGGAYLLLGERLTLAQSGGALLILVAVGAIIRLQHRQAQRLPATQAS